MVNTKSKQTKVKQQMLDAVAKSGILSSKCPKCGGEEIGYCFPTAEYDCACGHVWKIKSTTKKLKKEKVASVSFFAKTKSGKKKKVTFVGRR